MNILGPQSSARDLIPSVEPHFLFHPSEPCSSPELHLPRQHAPSVMHLPRLKPAQKGTHPFLSCDIVWETVPKAAKVTLGQTPHVTSFDKSILKLPNQEHERDVGLEANGDAGSNPQTLQG